MSAAVRAADAAPDNLPTHAPPPVSPTVSDRDSWTAPEPQPARAGVRGALGGSRLFEQPKQAAEVARFHAFIAGTSPLAVEIGFDHGFRLLDHARRWPDTQWLGLEVRKARVEAMQEVAPPNLLPWRADARTVFATLMPPSRLARVDILFPTPWWDETKRSKRMLFTPDFVADLATALAPGGVVHVATDVPAYFEHITTLFAAWHTAPHPASGDALSRRERVCARDGIPVGRGTWTPARR